MPDQNLLFIVTIIPDVIVIVLENEKMEIQSKLERTSLKLRIEFCTVLDECDVGTAEALRQIADR